ncbi:hypothetical protein HZC09_05070 [Candidatus Micrarchaeota archaeon]|nr:hypothetical protein [Candidatus Micrarchaeota archaeon]
MGIFDFFGKKPLPKVLYALECDVHPFRLQAHRQDAVDLEISAENTSGEPLLTSVIVTVPRMLGTDPSALSHEREVRLGMMAPGERRKLKVSIYSTQKSAPGTYGVRVHATAHYHDYGHILNQVRKLVELRVA